MDIDFEKLNINHVISFEKWGKHELSLFEDYNYDSEDAVEWYNWKVSNKNSKYFAIIFKKKAIGYISFKDIKNKESYLGIVLDPNYVGRHIGEEALIEALDLYFNKYDFDKINLFVARFNIRASKLYKKLGFKKTKSKIMLYPNSRIDFRDEKYSIYKKDFIKILGVLFFYADKMVLDKNTFNEVKKCISNYKK